MIKSGELLKAKNFLRLKQERCSRKVIQRDFKHEDSMHCGCLRGRDPGTRAQERPLGVKGSSPLTASRKCDLNLPREEPNSAITLNALEVATPLEPRRECRLADAW